MFYPIFDELKKYKKLIIAYIMVCMVTSVFVSPFFGTPRLSDKVEASDVDLTVDTDLDYSGEEQVSMDESFETLNLMFTKKAQIIVSQILFVTF